jgi:cell division initiation protein
MITPSEIQEKEFTRGVRGYKEEEVDMFLDLITLDLEKLVKENVRLKAEVVALEDELDKSKGSEGAVLETLEAAKALMGDISVSAEKRAEILLKNAELDAELTVREAKEKAERLAQESMTLKNRYVDFRDKYKRLLEAELERFENLSDDLFPEFDDERLQSLIGEKESGSATAPKIKGSVSDEDFERDLATSTSDRKTMVNIKR